MRAPRDRLTRWIDGTIAGITLDGQALAVLIPP